MKRNKGRAKRTIEPVLLDAFTEEQLSEWNRGGEILQRLADRVYFELEAYRAANYDLLCDALRSAPGISVNAAQWARVTDWRWSLAPLSAGGSVKLIGGRFNIGETLDRARGQSFPCLYIAETVDTAYAEYFGGALSNVKGTLTLADLALRRETSFATFLLNGRVERVLDLRDDKSLKAFAEIIRHFDISSQTKAAIRSAGLPRRELVRSAHQLRKRLLMPPSEWRQEPTLFAIPAASQIFGRFVRDSDFDAILYPSGQGTHQCLAIFPENFHASDSRIEVVGSVPPGASCTVLDRNSASAL
jgi:hypothetical protein